MSQQDILANLQIKNNLLKIEIDTIRNANITEQRLKRERTMLLTRGRVTETETLQMIKEKREQLAKDNTEKEKVKQKVALQLLDYKVLRMSRLDKHP